MKVKDLNASSRKTKILIRNAFAELIYEKKQLRKVTVTELVKKAGITRGAFYTHYDNIYEVADDFQVEALELLDDNKSLSSMNDVNDFLDDIFEYLKANEEIYKMILISDESLLFLNRLNKLINKKLKNALKENLNKDLILDISFFTDGVINLCMKYFRNEIQYSLDDINTYIKKMAKTMFFH